MALALLSGTTASIDFSVAGTSVKCHFSNMSIAFNRGLIPQITFCSSNFVSKILGLKEIRGSVSGYLAKGDTFSKFGQHFLTDTTYAIVGTFDTGCTISFTAAITDDAGSATAAGLMSRGLNFESTSADLAISWITT